MTGGGPGTSRRRPCRCSPTRRRSSSVKQIGFSTAIATIMLLVSGIFSVFYVRALRSEVD